MILFEDDDLVAIDKPSGLAVHRGWADDRDTAVDRVRAHVGGQVFPVHRLDRGTSGVLLFAKRAEVAGLLGALFAAGGARKRYLAIVRGAPPADFVVDHPVLRGEERTSPRVPARTRFSCLATVDAGPAADPRYRLRYSLVEAWPESGRLHQIRRHLKHASHPIIGDVRYGKREHNEICRTRFGLGRLALHATSLSFDDPRNGIERTIDAAVPRDLGEPLAAMGLR